MSRSEALHKAPIREQRVALSRTIEPCFSVILESMQPAPVEESGAPFCHEPVPSRIDISMPPGGINLEKN